MRHQLDPAIVRITNEVGTAVGLGVLVGSGQVLTCAHVVRDALGLAEMPVDPPAADLTLDFPLAEGDTACVGRVFRCRSELDVAVLVLTVPPPATARPISFVSADDLWGHPFRAFGFPKDRGGGVWAEGVMRGPQTQGWLQIDTGRGGYHVEPGFSGGPVWDDTLEGVVGLVTRSDPKAGVRAAYVIPAPVLIQAWPHLAAISRPPSPYRGLAAFRAADANNFFGRETTTARLLDEVNRKSLLAVVGPSGSGKSSVVFAGLVPALQSDGWLVIDFRPGRAPFASLAAALLPHLEPDLTEVDRLVETGKLAAALEEGTVVLADVLDRILARANAARVLLIADQFEELYALGDDLPRQHRFLDALLALLADQRSSPFTLCLTLRADFMGQALAYRPFADALQDHDLKLGPMTREELREAIERPAQRLHVTFEPGLVDRILDEVGQEPGNLPLLEFALTLLWERQRLGRLTHEAYQAIGGVSEALAQHAEAVFERLSAAEQDASRAVFVQLVRPGMGTADTRRLATREEVGDENWGLVQQLAGERLLTTGSDEGGGETVEVAHEALIQHWEQLRTWIAEDRTFREWQERLRVAMAIWQASGQDDGALLRGTPLAEAETWLAEHRERLPHSERAYIEVGVAAREAQVRTEEARLQKELALARAVAEAERARAEEQQARAEEQTRTSRGLRRRSMVALAVTALALLAAAGAIYFWTQAERGRRLAEAGEFAARSLEIMERDPDEGLLLAYRAVQGTLANGDPSTGETYRALHTALTQPGRPRAVLYGHTSPVLSASFSPDGARIVTASRDGTARLWDGDGRALAVLQGHAEPVQSATFSPDGQLIVTASEDGTARLWNSDGQPLFVLADHTGPVRSATFSPDGQRIIIVGDDNTAQLWNDDGRLLALLVGHSDGMRSAAFSPDGKRIITASYDGTARLWDDKGRPLAVLTGHSGSLWSVTFSADGERIVTTSIDGTARLWDGNGQALAVLEGHSGFVEAAGFSPDRRRIITAGADSTARLWDGNGRLLAVLEGHSGSVQSAVFSSNGQRILTASWDGTARLWDSDGQPLAILQGHSSQVSRVTFSPDGQRIVTAGGDMAPRLWDGDGGLLDVLEGHSSSARSVAFSPDGTRILTASYDRTARLWDSEGRPLATLEGHSAGLFSAAFSPDGARIVTVSNDDTARLWDGYGRQLAILEGHFDAVQSAVFSPDGTRILTASYDRTARLWDSEGRSLAILDGHTNVVNSATFSPNGTRIVTASWDGTARLWDGDGRSLAVLEGHNNEVYSAVFSPDGTRIVTASLDGTARLWHSNGQPLAILEGHADSVNSAVFSPDGTRIVTASSDGTARLWDGDGWPLTILEGHTGSVQLAIFSPDGTRIVTAGGDSTARLWQPYPNVAAMLTEAEQTLARLLPYEQCLAELDATLCGPSAELP